MAMAKIKMGDIYWVDFDGVNHEIKGKHPAIVVQNNLGNSKSPNVQVVPVSSSMTKAKLPTHVMLPKDDVSCLFKDSIAQCESQQSRSKEFFGDYIGSLPDDYMAQIAFACTINTPFIAYLSPEQLMSLANQVRMRNQIRIVS